MILLKIFDSALGLLQVSLVLCLFARYIYLEKGFSSLRQLKLFWGMAAGISLVCTTSQEIFGFLEDYLMLVIIGIFFFYIIITREKRRIRGLFLLFPILGFVLSIIFFMVLGPLLAGYYDIKSEYAWYPLMDIFVWILLLLFFFAGKNCRKNLSEKGRQRSLSPWERRLLNVSGIFLLILVVMLLSVKDLFTARDEGITFLLVGGISALLLDLSILFLVLQGNQKRYYEQKALENEYYLQAELRYFQARQKDQEAVRRLRHDMKNHLFCIQDLLSRGEKQDLAAYLEELNIRLSKNAGDLSLGNEIADAICWEKARLAEEKGIRITADGKISSKAEILPTDICTIFANALDNALEYLENSGLANPWIHIGIQNQRNLLCLVFENPVTDNIVLPAEGKTTKNPQHHQGLGLSNIRQAVERYQGTLRTEIPPEQNGKIFRLEVLLQAGDFRSQQNSGNSQQKNTRSKIFPLFLSQKNEGSMFMNENLDLRNSDEKSQRKMVKKETGKAARRVLFYNLILIGVVLLFTIFQSVGFLLQFPDLEPTAQAEASFMERIGSSGISSIAGVLVGVGLYFLWERKAGTHREIFRSKKKMRPLVFLGFLAVFMMVQLLSSVASVGMEGLFQLFGYTMADSAAAATGPSSTLSMFLYVGIAGPVAEELIYRGFVMRRLEKYGSFFAILFSSLLFGIMHGNLAQIFFAAAAGLIFGYLAMEYSIVWSILLHILNNLVFSDLLSRFTEGLPEAAANLISYGIMGIFTVIACVFLYKKKDSIRAWLKANPLPKKYCLWAFTGFWFLLFTVLEFIAAFAALTPVK